MADNPHPSDERSITKRLTEDGVDWDEANKDIVAYWMWLQLENRVWYLDGGHIHNLMDAACDEIERLKADLREYDG